MAVIEKEPDNPVPASFVPPGSKEFPVRSGINLVDIAEEVGFDSWQELTEFNWKTSDPPEVNWYLANRVGCTESSDGDNYSFSDNDDPGILHVPDDQGPVPGGGEPGQPSEPPPDPDPETPEPEPPDPENPVAPDDPGPGKNVNTLVARAIPLPLGWSAVQSEAKTVFKIWIPTSTPGKLTVKHLGGGKVDLRRPFEKVIVAKDTEIVHDVGAVEHGRYFVLAEGAADDEVECTFVQTAFSRRGFKNSDDPHIPWNFYYWPSARKVKRTDGSTIPNPHVANAQKVLKSYARAFGKDEDAIAKWEFDHHARPLVGEGWEGHCHNSAPASAIFEQPATVEHNGESFDQEEMEYLATEFTGNFSTIDQTDFWSLKRGDKPGGSKRRWFVPGYFKPGLPKTKAQFVKALKEEGFGDKAEEIADDYVSDAGGDDEFEKSVGRMFGELGAEFFNALHGMLRSAKQPLLSNMRSYNLDGGAHEVWNQVYFFFRMFYQEDLGEEKDMRIRCVLVANSDLPPDEAGSRGLPADINADGEVEPNKFALPFDILFKLRFDDSGDVEIKNDYNEWVALNNDTGDPLYAPTGLLMMGKCTKTRKTGNPFGLGNEHVGTDLTDEGLLKLHPRYK